MNVIDPSSNAGFDYFLQTKITSIHKTFNILKRGSCLEINNYRPIAVVFFFTKINRKTCVFTFNKPGFRREHSTHHALITLVDKITEALDEGSMMVRLKRRLISKP